MIFTIIIVIIASVKLNKLEIILKSKNRSIEAQNPVATE